MEFIDKSQIMRGIGPDSTAEILEKGKSAMIGEVREWQGKKYKKQANGKWLEVSEHGMTKKEHLESKRRANVSAETAFREARRSDLDKYEKEQDKHREAISKLSDEEVDIDWGEEQFQEDKKKETIKEQAKIGMPLYKEPIRSKVAKTDRFGFQIGDASHHSRYEVREFPNHPEVVSSVSKSWNSESVYVKYFNTKNTRSITVRFSNHMNNAVLFGNQLTPAATNEEILYELGILGRKPIIEESPRIVQQQIAKKDLDKYEEAELSLQEMYKLGIGADISKYKGKLAKNSNLLIESDTIKSKFNIVGFEYFEISKTDRKNELTEYAKNASVSALERRMKSEKTEEQFQDKSFSIKVGQSLKVPSSLTSDPSDKRGQFGKVSSIEDDIITLKFPDGKTGKYDRSIW